MLVKGSIVENRRNAHFHPDTYHDSYNKNVHGYILTFLFEECYGDVVELNKQRYVNVVDRRTEDSVLSLVCRVKHKNAMRLINAIHCVRPRPFTKTALSHSVYSHSYSVYSATDTPPVFANLRSSHK